MSEAFFILTIIFVAYVVYKTVNEQKETPKPAVTKEKPEVPDIIAAIQPIPEVVAKKIPPTKIKPATIKKTAPTPTAPNTVKKGLRDPKTGEVATSYSNYRFTKRWIKDALVAEGLIEKVYKNDELEPAVEAAIKEALVKLEAIDKYKP
jgi:hypothetical protein